MNEDIKSEDDIISNEFILTTLATGGAIAAKAALSAGAIAVATVVMKNLTDPNRYRDIKKSSLIEYTNITRVEPVVLFDETLKMQPYMSDIFQSLVNIFCGYYLQAIAITCNVGNIEVLKVLEKLSTNRNENRNSGRLVQTFMGGVRDSVGINSLKTNLLTDKYLESLNLHIANEAITEDEKDDELRKEWQRKKEREDRDKEKHDREGERHDRDKEKHDREGERHERDKEKHERDG